MQYYDLLKNANVPEWPYEVKYDSEKQIQSDVLIVGGGLGGCFAALSAAKKGLKVVIAEKGATIRSGAAGTGIDHWHNTFTNPASKYTPDEMIEMMAAQDEYCSAHASYINMMESFGCLLDMEEMGVKIRDTDDEFRGAPFRDEETKLLFAYEYDAIYVNRIFGHNLKPMIYKELKKLGVQIYDRIMITSLLNKDGENGNPVIGAVGFHNRTGEFYVFQAKATVLATAKPLRLWEFATELVGSNASHDDPNCAGDGVAMAYLAGAKFTMLERSHSSSGGRRYPAYSTGNAHNTWYPCTIVDADGKEVPWQDRDGNILKSVEERCHSVEGQKLFLHGPGKGPYETQGPTLIEDLPERIAKGEFKLPLYADLPSMPEYERNAIFGLMLGNEGKTKVPVVERYKAHGFDPNRDMLQANVLTPKYAGIHEPWWDVKSPGIGGPNIRETSFGLFGGIIVDWRLKSSLDGLYAVGNQIAGGEGAAFAASTGKYCGNCIAADIKDVSLDEPARAQIEAEKERIYRHVNIKSGIGWKEVQLGLCRIMQDYCGDYKSDDAFEMGLWWLNSIRENEIANICVMNPHDLARTMECEVRLTVGEAIMQQSLARKSSSIELNFERLDDKGEQETEKKFITIRFNGSEVEIGELPYQYWLKGENAPTYRENYERNIRANR